MNSSISCGAAYGAWVSGTSCSTTPFRTYFWWFTGVYPSEHRMVNKFAVYNATEKKTANLKQLSELRASGVLTESEFATAKARLTGTTEATASRPTPRARKPWCARCGPASKATVRRWEMFLPTM